MQSQSINVVCLQDPPVTFNTIRTQKISGSGEQSEGLNALGGADLYLTQLIADCLNGTAIFHIKMNENDDNMDGQPEEIDFVINKKQLPLKAPALPPIKNVDYVSTKEFVWKYREYERAIHIIQVNMMSGSSYPHTETEYVMVLPNIVTVRSIVLSSMIRNPLFTVWALIVTMVTIVRKLLQRFEVKVTRRSLSDLFFDSLGRAFGTSMIYKVPIRSERIVLIALSFVAVLAGIFCSGSLIEKFSTNQYTQIIRNVDDLKTSDYTLYVPWDFDSDLQDYFFENFKNISVQSTNRERMYTYIWKELHPQKYFAYVISASACLWLGLYSVEGQKRYNILPPFLSVSARLKVSGKQFQEATELTVVRAVEHGFVVHYTRSCRNALVQEFGNIDDSSIGDTSYTQGTIADLNFILSCIGISLSSSCVVFVCELLYHSKLRIKLLQIWK